MARTIDIASLLDGCADESFDDGIRIDTDLEPLSGPGGLRREARRSRATRRRRIQD